MAHTSDTRTSDGSTIDERTREEASEGVASTVYRARYKSQCSEDEAEGSFVAIKSATANRRFSPEPHDIIKEIAILTSISHANIIPILHSYLNKSSNRWELITPWIAYSLDDLLNIASFSPNDCPSSLRHLILPLPLPVSTTQGKRSTSDSPTVQTIFMILAKSIIYQTSLAISYLHGLPEPIAHRDIKPRNVLLTESGKVQLIDLGIAFERQICARKSNLWPETEDAMYSDVATGPYRAPELLFGPNTYDACATDLWSLGAFIAQFFTPIILTKRSLYGLSSEDSEDEDDIDDVEPLNGYIIAPSADPQTMLSYNAEWSRQTLFDASKGTIGLAWSIFKVFGTPSKENWPGFEDLPDAKKIQFMHTDGVALSSRLPNLPHLKSKASGALTVAEGETSERKSPPTGCISQENNPLDLIERLLRYPPAKRIRIADVIKHPWLAHSAEEPLILPVDHLGVSEWETEWHGEDLGYWLRVMFRKPGR